VHKARLCVHADTRFHPEVPLISLLRLVHFPGLLYQSRSSSSWVQGSRWRPPLTLF
jgi:hypothetical protein